MLHNPATMVLGGGLRGTLPNPQLNGSECLPRDTYIDEVFVVPLYRQLIISGGITLVGTASIVAIGTVVII